MSPATYRSNGELPLTSCDSYAAIAFPWLIRIWLIASRSSLAIISHGPSGASALLFGLHLAGKRLASGAEVLSAVGSGVSTKIESYSSRKVAKIWWAYSQRLPALLVLDSNDVAACIQSESCFPPRP